METHARTGEHKTDLNLRNVWLELQLVHLESLKQHFLKVFMATSSIPVWDYNSFYQIIKT